MPVPAETAAPSSNYFFFKTMKNSYAAFLTALACVALMPVSALAQSTPASVVAGKIKEYKKYCEGERIQTDVEPVQIAPNLAGAIVKLSTPDGGNCFGQPGENSYLVVKKSNRWVQVLAAEPGGIKVVPRGEVSNVELYSLGLCKITYAWTGQRYVAKSSSGCSGMMRPPGLTDLARIIEGK